MRKLFRLLMSKSGCWCMCCVTGPHCYNKNTNCFM